MGLATWFSAQHAPASLAARFSIHSPVNLFPTDGRRPNLSFVRRCTEPLFGKRTGYLHRASHDFVLFVGNHHNHRGAHACLYSTGVPLFCVKYSTGVPFIQKNVVALSNNDS